jgi:hypothetical protein
VYRLDSIDLGSYRDCNYVLVGYVEPEPDADSAYDPADDAENYGWSLVRTANSPLDDNIEIVRMDTRHGQPHLDRVFLPPDSDEPPRRWLESGYSYRRMRDYLLQQWQAFADLYIRYNE